MAQHDGRAPFGARSPKTLRFPGAWGAPFVSPAVAPADDRSSRSMTRRVTPSERL